VADAALELAAKYADWPGALRKLEYVDELMTEIAGTRPEPDAAHGSRSGRPAQLARWLTIMTQKLAALRCRHRHTRYDRDLHAHILQRRAPSPRARPPSTVPAQAIAWRIRRSAKWRISGAYQICAGQHDRSAHDQPRPRAETARAGAAEQRTTLVDGAHLLNNKVAHQLHSIAKAVVRCMKPLRVLAPDAPGPDAARQSREGYSEKETYVWKTEYDVATTLRASPAMKCACWACSTELKPDPRRGRGLEAGYRLQSARGIPRRDAVRAERGGSCSSCCACPTPAAIRAALMLARGKDLSKKLLKYHRVPAPAFAVFPMGKKVAAPGSAASFPLIVKSLWEDASLGIAQASIVDSGREAR
jgi:hypothetical protein